MAITQKQVRQFLLIGGGIFALTMAYGSGMRAQVRVIKEQHELYKIFRQEARVGQLAVRGREAQVQQLEARRLLAVAQNDLERGDIAAAKDSVSQAVTRLKTAQTADAATGVDFAALTADLQTVPLDNAPGAKRALHGLADAMDAQFARSSALPAPDALTKVSIAPPTDNEKPTLGNDVTRIK